MELLSYPLNMYAVYMNKYYSIIYFSEMPHYILRYLYRKNAWIHDVFVRCPNIPICKKHTGFEHHILRQCCHMLSNYALKRPGTGAISKLKKYAFSVSCKHERTGNEMIRTTSLLMTSWIFFVIFVNSMNEKYLICGTSDTVDAE